MDTIARSEAVFKARIECGENEALFLKKKAAIDAKFEADDAKRKAESERYYFAREHGKTAFCKRHRLSARRFKQCVDNGEIRVVGRHKHTGMSAAFNLYDWTENIINN